MKLRNISTSPFEFTLAPVPGPDGKPGKPVTIRVEPGAELEVKDDHPESMQKLADHYPKEWVVVEEKKLSVEELEAELAKRKKEEAAKKAADAKAKKDQEAADAKAKAEADAKAKAEADAKAKQQ